MKTPPLNQLYFYLTEGCNLRCRHCWIVDHAGENGTRGRMLPPHLFAHILDQAEPLGLAGVKLTGGEPLLHPAIETLLAEVAERGHTLTLETNGVLCTPALAERIAACTRAHVSVSLDGADATAHEWVRGVPGCFEAAVAGIRALASSGLRPQVIMSVMARNRAHMEPLVRLAESLGAGSVKFNPVQPIGGGASMSACGKTLSIEELVELGRWVETDLARCADIPVIYHHPAAFRPLSRMFGEDGDGCYRCGILNILGVLASGAYALCGIGVSVPELVFGRADRDALADVWANTPVLNELRDGLPRRLAGICAECLVKHQCLGACIAHNFYRTRSLWAPYWYCTLAAQKGLFPASRRAAPPEPAPAAAGLAQR